METKFDTLTCVPAAHRLSDETVDEELAERCVALLLRYVGEDPDRDGLKKTPKRVLKALREMTQGYKESPKTILSATFELEACSRHMIVLDSIQFTSLCEHHLLPFSGTVAVGYVPNPDSDRPIVGVSKLARLVKCFSRRLQVQERLTEQIADALHRGLDAAGVGVVVRATHSCMSCRGVEQHRSVMITSALRGILLTDQSAQLEYQSHLSIR